MVQFKGFVGVVKHYYVPFRTRRTFSYMFSEPNRLGGITKPYPSWMGADHADDLQYVFGKPFTTPLGYWPRHRDVSGYMIAYWTNFAKTGYNYNLINNIKSLKISIFCI